MFENLLYLLAAFIILLCLILLLFKKKSRHRYNIKKANQILQKLKSFNHNGQRINYLRKIDPFVFEELVLSAFLKTGYRIKRNKRYTGDGGFDGIIYDNQKNKILIQSKRYSSYINPNHISAFSALVHEQKAQQGFFVHTGKSSSATRTLFKQSNIELIGGDKLLRILMENDNNDNKEIIY